MKLTWILGAVLLASLAAGLWIVTAGQTRKETLARQRAQAQKSVETVIAQLTVPEEAIHFDFNSLPRIVELRRWSYERHGTAVPVYPVNPNTNERMPDYGERFLREQSDIEYKYLNDASGACGTVWNWFLRPAQSDTATAYLQNPEGAYLREHPEIYPDRIRPRLLALTQSYSGPLAVAAIKALWAAGENHDAGIQRLEEIFADENSLGRGEAQTLLTQIKHPLPVAPTDPSVLAAYAEPDRRDVNHPLPPGAAFRMDDPRLRHGAMVSALCLSADGKMLASGDNAGEIRLWDVQTGQYSATSVGPVQSNRSCQVNQVFLLPDRAVAARVGEALYLWQGGQTSCISPRQPNSRGGMGEPRLYSYIAISPDGKTLGGYYRQGAKMGPHNQVLRRPGETCDLFPLPSCLSPQEEQLVPDWLVEVRPVRLAESPLGQLAPIKIALSGGPGPWSMSNDGQTLAFAQGNRIRLFDLRGPKELFPPTFFCRPPTVLGRVDNRLFILADSRIRVFELPPRGDKATAPKEIDSAVPDDEIESASLAPGTRKLAIFTRKAYGWFQPQPNSPVHSGLTVLDLQTGQRLGIGHPVPGQKTIAMDPFENRYHLVVTSNGKLSIYDTRSGEVEYRFGCESSNFAFLDSPGAGCNLLALSTDGLGLRMYTEQRMMFPMMINGLLNSDITDVMAVSAGRDRLAVASNHALYVWNIQKWQDRPAPGALGPVQRILAPGRHVVAMAWLDLAGGASRFLVTAQEGRDDLVIWDVESAKPVVRLLGLDAQVESMHCDGQGLLYTTALDTSLVAWDVNELLNWCKAKVK